VASIVRVARRHVPPPIAGWLRRGRRDAVRLMTGVDVESTAREMAEAREEVLVALEQRTLDLLARQDAVLAGYDRRVAALINRVLNLEARVDGQEPPPEPGLDPHVPRSTVLRSRARAGVGADPEQVKLLEARLEPCVALLAEHAPVVDVGGNATMLALLEAASVPVTATGGDPLVDLARRPERSAGAVTVVDLVEGFELDDIHRLLGDVRRVLRPGGLVVVAATYPTSAAAFARFWRDPSRVRPWDATALAWLVRHAGMEVVDVHSGEGDDDDYVLVARRP
jgi:SAM-dependent methyltransferase